MIDDGIMDRWWREFKSNVTKVEEVAFNNQIEYHSIFTAIILQKFRPRSLPFEARTLRSAYFTAVLSFGHLQKHKA